MPNSTPTRFPFGVNNVVKPSLLGNYPNPNPLTTHEYSNDFDSYVAGDWTVTGTQALTAGNGGLLTGTSAGGGADIAGIIKNPTSFRFTQGLQTWFMWNGQIAALTQVLQVGLQFGGTIMAPTDGVYFTKAAASADVNLVMRVGGVSTTIAAVTTMAIATRTTLGYYFDGRANPTLYVFSSTPVPAQVVQGQPYWTGGVTVNSVGALAPVNTSLAGVPYDVNLAIAIGFQESAAGAQTIVSDYVFAANEILRF